MVLMIAVLVGINTWTDVGLGLIRDFKLNLCAFGLGELKVIIQSRQQAANMLISLP